MKRLELIVALSPHTPGSIQMFLFFSLVALVGSPHEDVGVNGCAPAAHPWKPPGVFFSSILALMGGLHEAVGINGCALAAHAWEPPRVVV